MCILPFGCEMFKGKHWLIVLIKTRLQKCQYLLYTHTSVYVAYSIPRACVYAHMYMYEDAAVFR